MDLPTRFDKLCSVYISFIHPRGFLSASRTFEYVQRNSQILIDSGYISELEMIGVFQVLKNSKWGIHGEMFNSYYFRPDQ